MKWSQLKKRVESTFCESAKGRVEVFETIYRKSPDAEGEAWITLDKVRFFNFANLTFMSAEYGALSGGADWREARRRARDDGVFPLWEFNGALFKYLGLSIDAILASNDSIIKGFGMLDRRFGKRRIMEFDVSGENELVKQLYAVRCRLERLREPAGRFCGQSEGRLNGPNELGILTFNSIEPLSTEWVKEMFDDA